MQRKYITKGHFNLLRSYRVGTLRHALGNLQTIPYLRYLRLSNLKALPKVMHPMRGRFASEEHLKAVPPAVKEDCPASCIKSASKIARGVK